MFYCVYIPWKHCRTCIFIVLYHIFFFRIVQHGGEHGLLQFGTRGDNSSGSYRKTAHLVPTWQDNEVLQSIKGALDPLSFLTDILSGEEYVMMSAVIPLLYLIENEALTDSETDTPLTRDIKHSNSHFKKRALTILKKLFLQDPCFK